MPAVTGPEPDFTAVPEGFVVVVDPGDRIHFLDWGGPPEPGGPGVLLLHGLSSTAWSWTGVARRLRRRRRTVAMDLRGHGLSDSPTDGYDPDTLADDAIAVAEGSGLIGAEEAPIVVAGHGFGAIVAAWTAARLGDRCAGLVLVDGGWEDVAATSGLEPAELLRDLDEPPEILRSMAAYLADREAFDPATWDADQEAAARAAVVETHAGRLVPVTRPHALARSVEAMFAYRPAVVLVSVEASIVALSAADDEAGTSGRALGAAQSALRAAGRSTMTATTFANDGHNLPRYRPDEVVAAILGVGARQTDARAGSGGG